jgi:hypothetical protein
MIATLTDLPLFSGRPYAPPSAIRANPRPSASTPPPSPYPLSPGSKDPDSADAAPTAYDANRTRQLCLQVLRQHGPQTPDEIAARMGAEVLYIRPRCSELRAFGHVLRTGERRPNRSGKPAHVLRAV